MRRITAVFAATLLAIGCQDQVEPLALDPPDPRAVAPHFAAVVDDELSARLAGADEADELVVIVTYAEEATTREAVGEALLDAGAGIIHFAHLPMIAAAATPSVIETMADVPGVEGVYLNAPLEYHLDGGVPSIRADLAHAAGVTGKGVGVAILDTGIDGLYNPDVQYPERTVQNVKLVSGSDEVRDDLSWATETAAGRNLFKFKGETNKTVNQAATLFVEDLANTETSVGHGTHVGGIAAGDGSAGEGLFTGVAPGANLIGISAGDVLFVLWALAGFDWILENHREYNIQVVNNSWGSTPGAGAPFDPNNPINQATKKLFDAGVSVVFSAGNCGPRGSTTCSRKGDDTLNRYSVAPWAISVAAGCKIVSAPADSTGVPLRCADDDGREPVLANFSARGRPDDTTGMFHPDITAPGVYIVAPRASTGSVMNALDATSDLTVCSNNVDSDNSAVLHLFYTCASGTSMSAPHIAGVIALLAEAAGGQISPTDALEAMTRTARTYEGFEKYEMGAGYVDALAAVEYVRSGN